MAQVKNRKMASTNKFDSVTRLPRATFPRREGEMRVLRCEECGLTFYSSNMARHQRIKHLRLGEEKMGAGLSASDESQDILKVKLPSVMQAVRAKRMLDQEEESADDGEDFIGDSSLHPTPHWEE